MKVSEKQKARELRGSGLTYREILALLPVSKSSLSYWLRDVELTKDQREKIDIKNLGGRKRFIEYNITKHAEAVADKENIFNSAAEGIKALSNQELKLIGIALYWAEGYKTDRARQVEFTNSDPAMIRLMMRWFTEICGVPSDKVRARIQIHNQNNFQKALNFWSLTTGIPPAQFTKPYIKISPTSKGIASTLLEHGVCHIRISDTKLLIKIKGWIKGLGGPIV